MCPISHIDMFKVPLHTFRCQSAPLTQFVPGDFADEDYAVPFRDVIVMRHKYSVNKLRQHLIMFRIERGTRWCGFYISTIYIFLDIRL